jgi:hypothetical protein
MPSATVCPTSWPCTGGIDGAPDRFASFAGAVTTAAVITTVVPLALVGLGVTRGGEALVARES